MKYKILFGLLFLSSFCIYAQSTSTYSQIISSSGEIPNRLNPNVNDYISKAKNRLHPDNYLNIDHEKLNEFYENNAFSTKKLLEEGKLIFGDSISNYVNKIGQQILNNYPELKNDIIFYVYRSQSVNAGCLLDGIIFINIGLIAHANNEAELAFILSHEIAHYVKNHLVDQFLKNDELKSEKKKNYLDLIKESYSYSREKELDADLFGLELFSKTKYNLSAGAIGALNVLKKSDQSFIQQPFNVAFFESENFKIPRSYLSDSILSVNKNESYFNEFHTHPDINERVTKIEDALNKYNKDNIELFIVSKDEFMKIQKMARLEFVRLQILHKNYCEALYNALALKQETKDKTLIDSFIAKAIYGLTKYKNHNQISSIITSPSSVPGESQAAHYFFKQLTRKQLNVLSINYLYELHKKYPENSDYLFYSKDLAKEFTEVSKLKLNDFHQQLPKKEYLDRILSDDYRDSKEKLKLQLKYDEFYKYAFVSKLKDPLFTDLFSSTSIVENNKSKKILILSPQFIIKDKAIASAKSNIKTKEILLKNSEKTLTEIDFFKDTITDIASYNYITSLNEWIMENYYHDNKFMIPLLHKGNDFFDNSIAYFYTSYIYLDKKNNISIYLPLFIDLKTNTKLEYEMHQYENYTPAKIAKYFEETINKL